MPCVSECLEPSDREKESVRVRTFLRLMGFWAAPAPSIYGDVDNLDRDTAKLCDWCKTAPDMSKQSLELQIWWRDHQLADAKREQAELKRTALKKLAEQARSKLTKSELDALLSTRVD